MKVWFLMGWMLLTTVAMAASSDSLLTRLNKTIDRKEEYTKTKLNRLEDLHQQLNRTPTRDDETRFRLLQEISEEYKAFIYDSAFINIQKLQLLAYKMKDPVRISYARVKLGFILLSSGMFKETIDTLSRMRVQGLPDSIRVD